MPDDSFSDWLDKNHEFWLMPGASEILDTAILDKQVQASIASSKHNQCIYGEIENYIAVDYARLVDFYLRQLYQEIPLEEFEDPKGFEIRDPFGVLEPYFQLREQIEYFLKLEIKGEGRHPDAQLNAFRRWICIADLLLRRHCYEGFLLIIVNLEMISNEALLEGLPGSMKKNFQALCELSSPTNNHSAMRSYIKAHQYSNDFTPLLLNCHAVVALNENISDLKGRLKALELDISTFEQLLESNQFHALRKQIETGRPIPQRKSRSYSDLIFLLKRSADLHEQKESISKQLKDRLEFKETILNSVKKEQQVQTEKLPKRLEPIYMQMAQQYQQSLLAEDLPKQPKHTRLVKTPSTLYRDKLLPGFWNRSSRTSSSYWDRVFTPSVLKG